MLSSITFISNNPPLKRKGSGISVLLYNILTALDKDYELNVVTFIQPDNVTKQEIEEDNSNVSVYVCDKKIKKLYSFVRSGTLKKLVLFIVFIINLPKLLRKYNKTGHLFITIVGASVMPVCKAWILKKLARKASHSLYIVDDLELINKIQNNRLEKFLIRIFLKRCIQQTDILVSISTGLKELYLQKYKKNSILLLPHFSQCEPLEKRNNRGEFVFLFTGGLNLLYNSSLQFFASALETLNRKEGNDVKYKLIIQTYSSREEFDKLKFNTEFVNYSTSEDRSSLRKIYQNCDCFLVPYSYANEDKGLVCTSFPQKIAEIIQYGRKILIFAPEYSSVSSFFSSQNLDFVSKIYSIENLVNDIEHVVQKNTKTQYYFESYEKYLSSNAVRKTFNEINKYNQSTKVSIVGNRKMEN